MIIGTAGHIDHGKTALVHALTGVDTDRLREEKLRGITIDLGYAYASLANGDVLGFVDVPGHEKFIHNMLAGATGVDYVLLIVAADDGPMPQTVEHLQILDLLGLKRGAVALTKTDLVAADRVAEVGREIDTLLSGTGLAGSRIFPVSAVTGEGIGDLRGHLERTATAVESRSKGGHFRLTVDRSFTLTGVGTVVTGTVFSGQVRMGDRLLLSPSGIPVRVRGIHAQNRPAQMGRAGERCALNLAGAEKQEARRGDWVLAPELHAPSARIDLRLRLLASEARALQHWSAVHIHLGTAHSVGRVALLQDESLEPGTSALAQIVLDKAMVAVHRDRCILRDAAAQRTIGGGIVLDAQPPSRGRRTLQRLAVLNAWEGDSPASILPILLERSANGVDLTAFARNVNLTSGETGALCRSLPLRWVQGAKSFAFAHARWESLRQSVIERLQQEHEEAPDSMGLNAEQLRLRIAPQVNRVAFASLLGELLGERSLARDGSWLHLPGHQIHLSEHEESLWRMVMPILSEQPFQPPRVRDLARTLSLDESAMRKLLMRVARTGRVYLVAHDHYFDRVAVADLASTVRYMASEHPDGAVLASDFRNRIGTGRKLAIHILEFFDRVGLTRRIKDSHRIRNDALDF